MRIFTTIRSGLERVIDLLSFSIFLILIIVGVYAIIDVKNVESIAELDAELVATADEIEEHSKKSFEELQGINPEVQAWIRIDDTHVDFPITYYQYDNNKYLARDYKLDFSAAGNPFIDYRNHNMDDDFTIIYGHRMSGTLMFSDVTRFEDKAYFADHKTGKIYTPEKTYDFKVLLFAKPVVATTEIYNLKQLANDNNDKLLGLLSNDIVNQEPNLQIPKDSKIAMVSTCDQTSNRVRNILLLELHERVEDN